MSQGKASAGHPVDVASGTLFSRYKDVSIRGKFELFWERYYSTGMRDERGGPFGPGWACPLFMTLTRDDAGYAMKDGDGALILFPDPKGEVEKGGTIRNLTVFHEIAKRGIDYVVTRWSPNDVDVECFVFRGVVKGKPWPLIAIEDPTGQGLDLGYTQEGQLREVKQRTEGISLLVEYGAGRKVAALHLTADGTARETVARYEYDAQGLLSAAFDALGMADRYEYDREGRMTREMAKDGGVFAFKFDGESRCVRASGIDGYDAKSIRYFPNIGFTEVTDSMGAVTRYQWLPTGQVVLKINPLGHMKKTEFDELGRIAVETDEGGAVTKYGFDAYGNRDKLTDAMGLTATTIYNPGHLPIAMIDKAGNEWKWEYDARNRLIAVDSPLELRVEYKYDERGNVIEIKGAEGAKMTQGFSERGRLIWSSDWEGNRTLFQSDPLRRRIRITRPQGGTTEQHYDVLGRLVRLTFPDGTSKSWEYNPVGLVTAATDAMGRTTRYHIGPCRRLFQRTDPDGTQVRYAWGSEPGRLLRIHNQKGEIYSFDHDPAGRVVHEKAFDGREMWFEYDPSGQIAATRTALGQETRFQRDAVGRVAKAVLPDGTEHAFAYNPLGDLLKAENPDCKVEFERNAVGRMLKAAQGGHAVEMGFVAGGLRTRIKTSQGLEAVFGFDGNERLRDLTVNGRKLLRYRRDAEGREAGMLFADTVGLAQAHNLMGNLVGQKVFSGAAMNAEGNWQGPDPFAAATPGTVRRAYQYATDGDLLALKDSRWGLSQFGYDSRERLLRATRDGASSEHFEFDTCDNLVRISDGLQDRRLDYAPGSRLQAAGQTAYAYDDQGRLVSKRVVDGALTREWLFTWNDLDQLRTAITPEGAVWTYRYDALGRRIAKEGPGEKFEYLWDGNKVVEVIRNGETHSSWLWATDGSHRPIASLQGGKAYAVISDHMGTPRELIDENGQVSWSAAPSAWGGRKDGDDGADCPIRFQGQWFDAETGFHYNRFRYYDPETGRFISPDPIGPDGGLNLYAYVANPLSWVDIYGWHGNNASSDNTQHVYEIKDNQTGDTFKYGISGQPMNQDGTSPRANTQVNALNNNPDLAEDKTGIPTDKSRFGPGEDQKDRFTATIVKKGIEGDGDQTAREKALALEQKKVDKYAEKDPDGEGPVGNKRPQPTKSCG
ncbi:MAG: RHS repeat protein [Fibrobacteres bacterium]|nr:RHS repeat protein [Fibrobacterota bacterium]